MDKITYKDLQEFKSVDDLSENSAYLFYGTTAKGATFWSTGMVKMYEPYFEDKTKSKKPYKKLYLDEDSFTSDFKPTHYIKLEY